MKIIAALCADLETTPLGTRSRLAAEVGGVPVMRRTIDRLSQVGALDGIYVLTPADQRDRCAKLLEGTGATTRPFDAPPPPWASLVRLARKWSLDGWRGGIGGATHFDEFTDARLLDRLIEERGADAVLSVPAGAVLVDPGITERMIEHYRATHHENRMVFAQAPPGIAGVLLCAPLVRELTENSVPLGWVLGYKPDSPQKDLIFQPCCVEIPAEVRYAQGRLVADTERSTRRVAQLLQAHAEPDAVTIGRWLSRQQTHTTESMPCEVEIELTTDDPYPDSLMRPRGSAVPKRGPIERSVAEQVIDEVSRFDDALIVLGGFGDPLRHPEFPGMLRAIRTGGREGHGPYGLAVRTAAVDLDEASIDALLDAGVDILTVTLDAWTPALYAKLQSPNDPDRADLEAVLGRISRLEDERKKRGQAAPAVVPELCKSRDNVQELDDFHDGWLRRVGAAVITGHSDYAGQFDDRAVMSMAPSPRETCRRIRSRCVVLADGRVVMCDQDIRGAHALGRIGERSLEELWQGSLFNRLRDAHRSDRFDDNALCAACRQWHRP